MFKKVIIYSVLIIAFGGFLALSYGFYQAMQAGNSRASVPVPDTNKEKETMNTSAPDTNKNGNTFTVTILGDSIAKGTGDENGKGFTGYLPDQLKNLTAKEVSVNNLGIDGLQSAGLLDELKSEKIPSLLKNSDMLLISIGGNDILKLHPENNSTIEDQLSAIQDQYISNLEEILRTIRRSAQNTYIVLIGLYNPYQNAIPIDSTRLLNTWNDNTQQLIEQDKRAMFVPTYDLFRPNFDKYMASDGIHPNSMGYQAMSDRIAKSIENIF